MILNDTEETLGFKADYQGDYEECMKLEDEGWVTPPDWFPIGIKGYEYRCVLCRYAYMKPRPKLRHVLRYRPFCELRARWSAKRWAKQWFKDMKER